MPRRLLVIICAAMAGAAVQAEATAAEFSPQVWLNPGIYSYHFDRSTDYRENNISFGAEFLITDDHALMAGSFINSDRQRSSYGLYEWRPLHWQASSIKLSAGIAAGAFDGYPNYRQGGWFVAPLPMLSVEGRRLGANFGIIPTIKNKFDGAFAIQVKLRVW